MLKGLLFILLQAACWSLMACGAAPGPAPESSGNHLASPRRMALAPIEQTLPATTWRLQMRPLAIRGKTGQPLWMSAREITWDAYDVFVFELDKKDPDAPHADGVTRPSKPYIPPDRGFGHHAYPALGMSYRGAHNFCRWLSLQSGRHYRLPTENEWQWACRTGGEKAPHTLPPKRLSQMAWWDGNAEDSPHPVGQKEKNSLGLFDMFGNVAEWCLGEDGRPVACGGSFLDQPDKLGCAARLHQTPAWQMSDPQIPKSSWWLSDAPFVGFRVVLEGSDSRMGAPR